MIVADKDEDLQSWGWTDLCVYMLMCIVLLVDSLCRSVCLALTLLRVANDKGATETHLDHRVNHSSSTVEELSCHVLLMLLK